MTDTLRARWEKYVERTEGCWMWKGPVARPQGYGSIGTSTQPYERLYAHRVSYELYKGPIPPGYQIDHLCRTPLCVNPAHLEAVTPQVNMLRGMHPSAVAVRTGLCKRGHLLAVHGALRKTGTRYCKECRRQQQREHYRRQEWPSMIAKRGGISEEAA